jgi:hypothetical protein
MFVTPSWYLTFILGIFSHLFNPTLCTCDPFLEKPAGVILQSKAIRIVLHCLDGIIARCKTCPVYKLMHVNTCNKGTSGSHEL